MSVKVGREKEGVVESHVKGQCVGVCEDTENDRGGRRMEKEKLVRERKKENGGKRERETGKRSTFTPSSAKTKCYGKMQKEK